MLRLPKVDKVFGAGLTGIKKIRNVVLAAAVGAGLSVGGIHTATAAVSPEKAAVSQSKLAGGALLLTPSSNAAPQQLAQSHYSHSSHSSHQSHYSHYSSR